MRYRSILILIVVFICALSLPLMGQPPAESTEVRRDPNGVALLAQALKAVAGSRHSNFVQDFKGTGTITYFWAGDEVTGEVIVKGKGPRHLHLQATLPTGIRSWAVSDGKGFLREGDGKKTSIPSYNAFNLGTLTFPNACLIEALQDLNMSISYAGLENRDGEQLHRIQIKRRFANDPDGVRARLTAKELLIDATTFYIVAIADTLHPNNLTTGGDPHEVRYSDYRTIDGILIPFSITELANNQILSRIGFTQVVFNTGLTDSDFEL